MALSLHLGLGHPSLTWLVVTAALSAIAGGGIVAALIHRSRPANPRSDVAVQDS